ncbi:MAG: hypothetical protein ACLFU0_00940 [Alphaproteobacteria bacterium]
MVRLDPPNDRLNVALARRRRTRQLVAHVVEKAGLRKEPPVGQPDGAKGGLEVGVIERPAG